MRGILFTGKAELTDKIEVRDPRPDEVVVRIGAAGLCHSDVSVIDGTIPFPPPVVLGHEGAGVVEEVGSAVTTLEPGDHVVLSTLSNCGMCPACESGHPTVCTKSIGKLTKPFTVDGEKAFSFANVSAFVERTVVGERQAVKIDPDVPLASAALIGCAVMTGVGAVLNRAKVTYGQSVAVIGMGGIGLNVIQASVLAGATTVIAVDTVAGKESMAREFGATHFVDATHGDTVEAVKGIVAGGVDYAFECVGHPAVIRNAIDMLGWGGNCVILGVPRADAEASFLVSGMYMDKGILGCRYGSSRPRADIPLVVDLYKSGRLKLDELITRTYPLEDFEKAVHDLHAGELARGVLTL
jgi:S-(hydroxymethyl)glutathione dehydrogenase/alcohol dehydrogenase